MRKIFEKITDFFETMFSEMSAHLYSIFVYHKGAQDDFHYHGLNPDEISDEESDCPAVLFLHGMRHNQSGALPLAEKLRKEGVSPVFTLNYAYEWSSTALHQKQLREKIKSIANLYQKKGKVAHLVLIGHSRGAILATYFAFCVLPSDPIEGAVIDKVISIAAPWNVRPHLRTSSQHRVKAIQKVLQEVSEHKGKIFHIAGDSDWLSGVQEDESIVLRENRKIVRNRSHLGVLYCDDTHVHIVKIIKKG